jgi:hypothetical protein
MDVSEVTSRQLESALLEKGEFDNENIGDSIRSDVRWLHPWHISMCAWGMGSITIIVAMIITFTCDEELLEARHEGKALPYVSDFGTFDPARIFFTLGSQWTAFALLLSVVAMHHRLDHMLTTLKRRDDVEEDIEAEEFQSLNHYSLIAGIVGAISLSILGAVPESSLLSAVHFISALTMFTSLVIWQSFVTSLYSKVHHVQCDGKSIFESNYRVKVACAVFAALSLVIMLALALSLIWKESSFRYALPIAEYCVVSSSMAFTVTLRNDLMPLTVHMVSSSKV